MLIFYLVIPIKRKHQYQTKNSIILLRSLVFSLILLTRSFLFETVPFHDLIGLILFQVAKNQ